MKITIVFNRGHLLSGDVRDRLRSCLTTSELETSEFTYLRDIRHWSFTFRTENLASVVLYGFERDGFDLSGDFASITIS